MQLSKLSTAVPSAPVTCVQFKAKFRKRTGPGITQCSSSVVLVMALDAPIQLATRLADNLVDKMGPGIVTVIHAIIKEAVLLLQQTKVATVTVIHAIIREAALLLQTKVAIVTEMAVRRTRALINRIVFYLME